MICLYSLQIIKQKKKKVKLVGMTKAAIDFILVIQVTLREELCVNVEMVINL